MSQWAAEVKARGVAPVAAALGFTVNGRHLRPCPACQETRRGTHDPREPVGLTADGLGWRCHRCKEGGDAVTLAAFVHLGRVLNKGETAAWRAVGAFCEAQGLATAATPSRPATAPRTAQNARARAEKEPASSFSHPIVAPRRLPEAEVQDVWARGRPVTEDAEVCAWLLEGKKRRIDPVLVADRDLARALPRDGRLPAWCKCRRVWWHESAYRLIVPLYGPGGRLESLHARAVAPVAADMPKAASPLGFDVGGLVLADALGRVLLEGTPPPGTSRVTVAEGVPDFLTWAIRFGDAAEDAPAVLGVIAGSWTPEIAATIPTGWTVIIRTHNDAAGHKYAETIRASLAGRCFVKWRSRVSA